MSAWSKKTPDEQGWFWYRASKSHHPTPTFVEDCGRGMFRAVEVYDHKMVDVKMVDVEWWPQRIPTPIESVLTNGECKPKTRKRTAKETCGRPDCEVEDFHQKCRQCALMVQPNFPPHDRIKVL